MIVITDTLTGVVAVVITGTGRTVMVGSVVNMNGVDGEPSGCRDVDARPSVDD